MKPLKKLLLQFVIVLVLFNSCSRQKREELVLGPWRGEFAVEGKRVPFNFSVEDDPTGTVMVYLLNGEEKAPLDSVYYQRDSVIVDINVYDALLIGKISNDSISGYFRKNQSTKKGIPFKAARNQKFRFFNPDTTSQVSVSGKWSVILTSEKDGRSSSRHTVGVFEQKGTQVTGTVLTTTGDYRFLEGTIDGQTLKLSAFSGSNPLYLEASLTDNLHLRGEFLSPGGSTKLVASKSDTTHLPDPYTLTYLKKGFNRLDFSFPDLHGNLVSAQDAKFKGKVLIVTITGSWCPNCYDEAEFLSLWYDENKNRGIEILALSFERKDDPAFAKKRLDKFIKRFDIKYDVLFAGLADKKLASEKLPAINALHSFPTTFIIDRKGNVRKIHTGWTGPATGIYYKNFIEEFNRDVDALVREPSELVN